MTLFAPLIRGRIYLIADEPWTPLRLVRLEKNARLDREVIYFFRRFAVSEGEPTLISISLASLEEKENEGLFHGPLARTDGED